MSDLADVFYNAVILIYTPYDVPLTLWYRACAERWIPCLRCAPPTECSGWPGVPADAQEPFGNQYTRFFPSSTAAAWADDATPPQARGAALVDTLEDIAAMHTPILGTTLPAYLQDLMVNSLSHTRDAMWWLRCPNCHVSSDPRVNGTAGHGFWRQVQSSCADMECVCVCAVSVCLCVCVYVCVVWVRVCLACGAWR